MSNEFTSNVITTSQEQVANDKIHTPNVCSVLTQIGKNIDDGTFSRCTTLSEISIPENIQSITEPSDGVYPPTINLYIVSNAPVFYTNEDVMTMFNIKQSTLQKLRNDGYLSYHRLPNGDKIWYTQDDIKEFLDRDDVKHIAFS